MTVAVIVGGLLPLFWGGGTGSEVMQRIAAPMIGGMLSAPLLSMFVVPAVYRLMRRRRQTRAEGDGAGEGEGATHFCARLEFLTAPDGPERPNLRRPCAKGGQGSHHAQTPCADGFQMINFALPLESHPHVYSRR